MAELIELVTPKAGKEFDALSHKLNRVDKYNCADKPERYIDAPESVTDDEAEEMCFQCPAIRECYLFATKEKLDYGVWGGINFTSTEQKESSEDTTHNGSEELSKT